MQKNGLKFLINFLFIAVLSILYVINTSFYLKNLDGRFEVYLESNSSNAEIVSLDKNEVSLCFSKVGEACLLEEKLDVNEIFSMFNATLVFVEEIEGQDYKGTSYYAYSDEIKYKKIINGKKINLHIFTCEEYVKVGSPLIYGSF